MPSSTYSTFSIAPIGDSKHAARLTVSQPPLNLVNGTFLTELHNYLESLQRSPGTAPKVLVVSSGVPGIWISHLDLHIVSAQYPLENKADAAHYLHLLGSVLHLFTVLPTVFIVEVNGLAVGGGMDVSALTKLIGPGRAMELMLSSRAVGHKEATRLGLVNRAADDEDHLRELVDALATRIAVFPLGVIEGTKQSVRDCLDGRGSMRNDMQLLGKLAHTAIAQKAVSAFIEHGEQYETKDMWELGLPDTAIEVWE